MKETVIIISVILLIFLPGIWFNHFLDESGQRMVSVLEEMKDDIENGKQIEVAKVDRLYDTFLDNEKKWILIVDHEMLDEIEDDLQDCIGYYKENEKADFLISFEKLKNHISDLSKREEISVANIF